MRWAALALVCLCTPGTRAAEPPAPNAALQYWQAFAALPAPKGLGERLTDDEQKRLEAWETSPLDDVTASALKKNADALAYLHRGVAISHCLWASQLDLPRDGVGTRCPQVARSHEVRFAALLRARYRFANGQGLRAVDDLFALVRFARHLEVGSSLVGVLIAYSTERDAVRVLAANMWALASDADLLNATKMRWDELPAPQPMVEAIRAERNGLTGMIRHHAHLVRENQPDDEIGVVIGFIPTLAFILGHETFDQSVVTLCGTIERHGERLVRATSVPPDKIVAAEEAFFADWDKDTAADDPVAAYFAKTFRPAVGALRLKEAEMHTRRAMLRAALAVAGEGRDKLKVNPDPFGNAPFETRPVEGGYELKSRLGDVIEKPVVLVVRSVPPSK